MGEISEMMLGGVLCECCGVALVHGPEDEPSGVPTRCLSCMEPETQREVRDQKVRQFEAELYGEPDELSEHEVFAAQREQSRDKRRQNLRQSTELLRQRGVKFEAKNNGVHLIVRHGARVFDFWPSTGKWIERDRVAAVQRMAWNKPALRSGRGVFNMLQELGA